MSLQWFSKAIEVPTSSDTNTRFAERLNSVWFKRPGGVIRLGLLLTKILSRLDSLEKSAETRTALSASAANADRYEHSSMNRTATGMLRSQPSRTAALYYGLRFIQAVGDQQILYTALDPEMEAAVVEAGRRLRFERKEKQNG